MQRRITIGRFLLLALIISALAAPAAPAAADTPPAGEFWHLTSHPVAVKRGGQTYQMTVSVHQYDDSESLSVTLSQKRDPKGVAVATQSHSYTFDMSGNRFTQSANLSKAKVGSAKTMGSYGAVALEFAKNAATKSSCKGHVKSRSGKLKGSLTLKTGTKLFGTIKNVPSKGTLHFSDGKCGTESSSLCPSSGLSVSAHNQDPSWTMVFSKTAGAKTADMWVYKSEAAKIKTAYIGNYISVQVPAKKVTIASDLSSAKVSAVKGTWLSGAGEFTGAGEAFDTPATACGRNKEYVTTLKSGEWQGNLSADFFLGTAAAIKGTHGTAYKSKVS